MVVHHCPNVAGQLFLMAGPCPTSSLFLFREGRTTEDPSSHYSPSPNLMTGWRGRVEAGKKEFRTGIGIGQAYYPLLKDVSKTLQQS